MSIMRDSIGDSLVIDMEVPLEYPQSGQNVSGSNLCTDGF